MGNRIRKSEGRSPDESACEGLFGRLKNEFFYCWDRGDVAAWSFLRAELFITVPVGVILFAGKASVVRARSAEGSADCGRRPFCHTMPKEVHAYKLGMRGRGPSCVGCRVP